MDTKELKNELIKLADEIEQAATPIIENSMSSQAAEIRARVLSALQCAHEAICTEIYNIH